MNDYPNCDATELAKRVARKEISPAELVDVAMTAIERVNPKLNAVVYRMYDLAKEQALQGLPEGPLHGVPMVVKDFDGFVRDVPFTASCRLLEGYVPKHDSEAIARMRAAGASFLAKTNLPELALLGTTEPAWRGPTRNPWSLDHSTGGSSGGSAALVASRAVPAGHGGDGGGSLRIPASQCGLVGFKATRGRIPHGPDAGEGWGGYTQWGVLTRTIRDAALYLDVLCGPMLGDPYWAPPLQRPLSEEVGADPGKLRVAMTTESLFGKSTHPDCALAVEQMAATLADLGHEVEEAKPIVDAHTLVRAYLTQVAVGTAVEIDEFAHLAGREAVPAHFEPGTWMLVQIGRTLSGVELQKARDAAHAAARTLAAFHERYDVLITPTVARPPVRIGELALTGAEKVALGALRRFPVPLAMRKLLDRVAENNLERTPNTQLFNQTGQPAVSIPGGRSEQGLPLGVQLVGRFGEDATLIRLAAQLEAAQPWIQDLPQLIASR